MKVDRGILAGAAFCFVMGIIILTNFPRVSEGGDLKWLYQLVSSLIGLSASSFLGSILGLSVEVNYVATGVFFVIAGVMASLEAFGKLESLVTFAKRHSSIGRK